MPEQLRFSATHLFVIDGMPDGHDRTAHALVGGLENRLRGAPRQLITRLHRVARHADFALALAEIETVAKSGGLPMIHLDGHADRTGFRTSQNDIAVWSTFWDACRRINTICRNNLSVTAGACRALYAILDGSFSLMEASPVFVFIAPQQTVAGETVEIGFELYYEHLFRTGDVTGAYEQLIQIDQNGDGEVGDFRLVTAQDLFEKSAAGYIVKHCMGIGARRRYMRLVHEMEADGQNTKERRAVLRRTLRGSQAESLRGYHERFMMIDLFPDLRPRLGMDYQRFECAVRADAKAAL